LSFADIFYISKLESWAIVWRCLRDPIRLAVSVEHRLVSDRQTDKHTTTTANTRAS